MDYINNSKNNINYYKIDGRLKGWNTYLYVPLTEKLKKYNINDPELVNFLLLMLTWDPKNRASIQTLLKHNWLSNINLPTKEVQTITKISSKEIMKMKIKKAQEKQRKKELELVNRKKKLAK